jgi:hypothetical protein
VILLPIQSSRCYSIVVMDWHGDLPRCSLLWSRKLHVRGVHGRRTGGTWPPWGWCPSHICHDMLAGAVWAPPAPGT